MYYTVYVQLPLGSMIVRLILERPCPSLWSSVHELVMVTFQETCRYYMYRLPEMVPARELEAVNKFHHVSISAIDFSRRACEALDRWSVHGLSLSSHRSFSLLHPSQICQTPNQVFSRRSVSVNKTAGQWIKSCVASDRTSPGLTAEFCTWQESILGHRAWLLSYTHRPLVFFTALNFLTSSFG